MSCGYSNLEDFDILSYHDIEKILEDHGNVDGIDAYFNDREYGMKNGRNVYRAYNLSAYLGY